MRAPEFWQKGGVASLALAPLGWIWAGGAMLRARGAPRHRASVPVVCVGNLTAGGAGKTPVALSIARMIEGAHFLSRGYGGSAEGPLLVDPRRHSFDLVGDEALLLAEIAPCWVAKDRAAGARAAAEAGARCLVLDDGFQDPALAKDIALLVVDGPSGFGIGRCLPAGPLREPVGLGLRRATAVVVIGEDRHDIGARVAPTPLLQAWMEPQAEAQVLAGRKVVAFAGIGRPGKFFHAIERLGGHLIGAHAFPDHYPFNAAEITELQQEAAHHNAFLITTSKDHVRIPPPLRDAVGVLQMDIAWQDEQGLLDILMPALRGPTAG